MSRPCRGRRCPAFLPTRCWAAAYLPSPAWGCAACQSTATPAKQQSRKLLLENIVVSAADVALQSFPRALRIACFKRIYHFGVMCHGRLFFGSLRSSPQVVVQDG